MNPKAKQEKMAREAKAALAKVAKLKLSASKSVLSAPQLGRTTVPKSAPAVPVPVAGASPAAVVSPVAPGQTVTQASARASWWARLLHSEARVGTEAERRAEAERQRLLIAKDVKHAKPTVSTKPVVAEEPLLKRRAKVVRRRRPLKELFKLAGREEDPSVRFKSLVGVAFWITLALTILAVFMGSVYGETFKDGEQVEQFVVFAVALWTVGFVGIIILCIVAYLVWIDMQITRRRQEIEAVFPDYLQLAAANLSAGMTIDRALWMAVRPRFGVLAKEMEDVAKKTMTGYDLERSLKEFSDKYDSIVIKRAVDLICEGSRSGGRMAEILNKIATNIQENNILQKEMAANVTTYVIFISFASVLASPFLFALSTHLLIVIQQIAGSIAVSQGGSSTVGLQLSADAVKLGDFKIFSYVALAVTSTMSACIVSVIRKGSVFDGLRLAPMYCACSLALYWIGSWALGFLFGGFMALG